MKRWHLAVGLLVSLLVSIIASHFNPGQWSWSYLMSTIVIGAVIAALVIAVVSPELRAWVRIYRYFRSRGTPRRVSARLACNRLKA
jgi:uncharacterized integral membrane protein